MTDHTSSSTSSSPDLTLLDGEREYSPSPCPLTLPTTHHHHEGVRVVYSPDRPPLYEVDGSVWETLSPRQMCPVQALVWLGLQGQTCRYTRQEAASLLLDKLAQRDALTFSRRRILEHQKHLGGSTSTPSTTPQTCLQHSPYDMQSWLERWWPSLRAW